MKRVVTSLVALLLVCGYSLFVTASVAIVPSETWVVTGDMEHSRAGAAAVLLADGVVLVTGGVGNEGATSASERYAALGRAFVATTPMNTPRTNHTATLLADGRVLVIGGLGADSAALTGAEIYDPRANSWSPAGDLVHARAGHTATMMGDGRVLIAGGENSSGPLSTLEVFAPAAEDFVIVTSPMSAPRTRHAAALVDGKVMIIGGWDGAAALASVDVFDPATDSVMAGPSLLSARAEHSATTLLRGEVLVAGGMTAADGELQTAEFYDAAIGQFVATANMLAPRRNHLAMLLPHNNSVLIAGGWSRGAESETAELYRSWQDGGTFRATGQPLVARNWAAGSPLSFPASATNRGGIADGRALVAGGADDASAELYGFATVKTDKDDYQPGDVVYVSGSGWVPNQPVSFYVRELPAEHFARIVTIDADGSGNINGAKLFDVEEHHLGVQFLLTAADGVSQAHMAFTDSNPQTIVVATPTSVTVTQGGTAVYGNVKVIVGGNNNPCTITLSAGAGLPAGAAAVFGTNSQTTTGADFVTSLSVTTTSSTPTGTFTFQVTATNTGAGCQGPGPTPSAVITLNVTSGAVSTTTTASNATATYGDSSVALNATVSPAAGVGTVLFTIKNGVTTIGTATSGTVTGGSASATFPLLGVNAGTYTIEAAYSGGTGFNASNNSTQSPMPTLTVNKAPTVTTVSCSAGPFTYNGAAQTPCTANVTGAGGLNQSLTVNYANNTNAGSASASATFVESANYLGSSNSMNFAIGKAGATIVVNGYTGNYDGAAHGAAGSATGALGETLAGLDLGASFTNVPGGTANWTFTDVSGNYTDDSGNVAIVINKANATIIVNGYTGNYDGVAHGATGTATGVLNEVLAGLNLGASFTNVPGGTANWAFTDVTGNYNDASGTAPIVINKATATIIVSGYTGYYDGSAHGATGTATGVSSEALAGLNLGASFTNVPGGTANWTFIDVTGNYNDANGTAAIVINKANPTISVSGYTGIYDATAHGATGTATGVSSEALAGLNLGASFTNVPGGNANWAFTDVTGNYNNLSGSVPIVITPKPLTITANNRAKLLGEIVTFLGTEFTQIGLVGTDSITSVTLNSTGAPASAPVGTYPIIPSSAVGSGLTNYTVGYANGVLTVGYKICALYNESLAHKKGSTIPIKLNLCDVAGNNVSSAATVVKAAQIVRFDASASPFVAEDSGNANPDLDFRYAGDSYIFNLSTKSSGFTQGTWGINFTVDGVVSTAYIVKFDIK